jgi:XapX domain-containing protein
MHPGRMAKMRVYVLSLGAGLLVGVIYSLLHVRSPAPPVVALVGLMGILMGEQVIPVGKQLLAGTSLRIAWHRSQCGEHVFGELPGLHTTKTVTAASQPVVGIRS